MKFGGASLGSGEAVRGVLDLIRAELDRRPVVVVSAHAGVTDLLVEAGHRAAGGSADIDAIRQRHRELLADLGLSADLLDPLLGELGELLAAIGMVGRLSPRLMDQLLSYGERCSARVVAAALSARGVAAAAVDAGEAGLRTDGTFGRARPRADDGRIAAFFAGLASTPVVTGFIGADDAGNVTTLGRNGSDFSAALFGEALSVDEIQIWKHVDGVMSADPRLVPDAGCIAELGYGEAVELARWGGRVLHPSTLEPAMRAGIPLRVRNALRPAAAGTTLTPTPGSAGRAVCAIAHQPHVATVRLAGIRGDGDPLGRLLALAHRHGVVVDRISLALGAVALSTATELGDGVLAELAEVAETVSVEEDATIGLVGAAAGRDAQVAAWATGTLRSAGVGLRGVATSATGMALQLFVPQERLVDGLRALHARLDQLASRSR